MLRNEKGGKKEEQVGTAFVKNDQVFCVLCPVLQIVSVGPQVLNQRGYVEVLMVKNPPANAGDIQDTHSVPGLGISLEEGISTPVFLAGDSAWTESLVGCGP